jgi:Ran GTPase-activating protein (RanGAP) involved in mRNA processing and transport
MQSSKNVGATRRHARLLGTKRRRARRTARRRGGTPTTNGPRTQKKKPKLALRPTHESLSKLQAIPLVLARIGGFDLGGAQELHRTTRSLNRASNQCELTFGRAYREVALVRRLRRRRKRTQGGPSARDAPTEKNCLQTAAAVPHFALVLRNRRLSRTEARVHVETVLDDPTVRRALVSLQLPGALRAHPSLVERVVGALPSMARLASLDLSNNHISCTGAKALAQAMPAMGALTSLDMSKNDIGGYKSSTAAMGALAVALKANAVLQELNLASNDIRGDEAKILADGLSTNGALEKLLMADNNIATKEAGEALGHALAHNSVLKELDLSDNNSGFSYNDGPSFAKGVADGLSTNGALTSLNISNNGIGKLVWPEGWQGWRAGDNELYKFYHSDGRKQDGDPGEPLVQGKPEGAIAISNAINTMWALTSLHIGNNSIPIEKMNEILAMVEAKPAMKVLCAVPFRDKSITELDVSSHRLGVEGALVIRRYLENNGALVKFDISSNDIRRDGAQALAEALKDNQVMKELNIASNELYYPDLSGVTAICNAIPTMGALVKFNVSDNDLCAAGGKTLAEALKDNQIMTELNIASNYLGKKVAAAYGGVDMAGVIAISNAIPTMGALAKFNISDNKLCAPGTKTLAEALKGNQIMTELNISSNGIGLDDWYNEGSDMPGVEPMASAIPTMGALTSLNMSNNMLATKASGKALAGILSSNSVLKELDVSKNAQYPSGGSWSDADGPGFANALAVGISANGALEKLDLRNTGLGDEALKRMMMEVCRRKGIVLVS